MTLGSQRYRKDCWNTPASRSIRFVRGDVHSAVTKWCGYHLLLNPGEVVVLRYQEGLTHPEIAEILGLPSGTVKTYLHRARKELATILKPFA